MTPLHHNTVHVVVFAGLVHYLERHGYSLEAFRRLSGVDADVSGDPDARVPVETMVQSWQAALELTRDPALGFAVGADYSSHAHGVLGHLISHSDDLGAALRVLCRFQMLLSGGNPIELVETKNDANIVLHADDPNPITWPTVVERIFASIVTLAKNEAIGRFTLTRVEFDFEEPAYAAAYRKFLGAPCEFGARECRLVFPKVHLGLAMRHRHPTLHTLLSREVETMHGDLRAKSETISAKLAQTLPSLLDRGLIAARSAAAALSVSERTLHRRLAREGTTYLELLDKTRLDRALRLMPLPNISLEEIALACGFLESSGFYRAFQRWTGTAPRAYRKNRMAQSEN